jgi:HSP90 family molecular chaperone
MVSDKKNILHPWTRFTTDDFKDMMPSNHSFVKGIADSDDLPINVSGEILQQHKPQKLNEKKGDAAKVRNEVVEEHLPNDCFLLTPSLPLHD